MYNNRSRGFTLIELLVVIAIIGILSSVVLASLNTARNKGNDAAIQSDLSAIATEAEIYYGGTGVNSYGADGNASCSAQVFSAPVIVKAVAAVVIANPNATMHCASSKTQYVIMAKLVATGAGFWCVDSAGTSKGYTTAGGTSYPSDGSALQCP